MTTPISSSVPFGTSGDLQAAHDVRQLGDMVLDNGTRETGNATLNADQIINVALMKATGMIEMSCYKGNKYSVQDLQSLTGASRMLLVDLCVEIAWWKLYSRRHPDKPMQQTAAFAFSTLEAIESGAAIFGLQEQADAGNPEDGFETVQDVANRGGVVFEARRFFGVRGYQLRGSQSGQQGSGGCGCG